MSFFARALRQLRLQQERAFGYDRIAGLDAREYLDATATTHADRYRPCPKTCTLTNEDDIAPVDRLHCFFGQCDASSLRRPAWRDANAQPLPLRQTRRHTGRREHNCRCPAFDV